MKMERNRKEEEHEEEQEEQEEERVDYHACHGLTKREGEKQKMQREED